MAEIKVSEMLEAESVNDEDLIMIVQNGVNKKVPASKVGTGQAGGDTLPIGAVLEWNSDIIPTNWLLCDGQEVSRTEYSELFEVLGTKYGEGDGSTTFNLPNRKGNVAVGKDEEDTDFNELGKTGGEKEHTLTVDEMPKHKHGTPIDSYVNTDKQTDQIQGGHISNISQGTNFNTLYAGGNKPHNNLQPYIVSNFIIKAKQSAGLVATVVDNLESESETDALSAKQGKELNDKFSKNIITAYPNSSLTDITEANQKVNLDGYDSIGEKITVENNAIKIGKGISKILISAQIFYQDGPTGNGYYFPNIKINDKIVARSITPTSTSGGSSYITAYINEFLIDVKEGDLITLSTGESPLGYTNLKYRGIQYGNEIKRRHTYITVEAIV